MQDKDFIRIKYSGKVKESGQALDSGDNVPVIVGAGYVIKGIDEALKEMSIGEKRTIEIQPEKAFGPRDPKLIKLISISEFRRHGTKPAPGMFFTADNLRGRVLSVSSGRVTVDFNHPLAGKILIYDLEIKEKIEKPEEKIKAIIEFYTKMPQDKFKISISEKEVEIIIPPMLNPILKKKISSDIIKFMDKEKVKLSEIYEKIKE